MRNFNKLKRFHIYCYFIIIQCFYLFIYFFDLKVNYFNFTIIKLIIILLFQSYDVIVIEDESEIIRKFKGFESKIVFSAENFCWPDPTLKDDYPPVSSIEKRFLNSGLIIGYIADFINLINSSPIKDADDDQLFYTKLFLNKRNEFGIKLDTKSQLFHNLNGASEEISIFSLKGDLSAFNNKTQTVPSVLHGNGGSKVILI